MRTGKTAVTCDRRTGLIAGVWTLLFLTMGAWEIQTGALSAPRFGMSVLGLAGIVWLARLLVCRMVELRRVEEWMRTQRDLAAALGGTSDLSVALRIVWARLCRCRGSTAAASTWWIMRWGCGWASIRDYPANSFNGRACSTRTRS